MVSHFDSHVWEILQGSALILFTQLQIVFTLPSLNTVLLFSLPNISWILKIQLLSLILVNLIKKYLLSLTKECPEDDPRQIQIHMTISKHAHSYIIINSHILVARQYLILNIHHEHNVFCISWVLHSSLAHRHELLGKGTWLILNLIIQNIIHKNTIKYKINTMIKWYIYVSSYFLTMN